MNAAKAALGISANKCNLISILEFNLELLNIQYNPSARLQGKFE
jgi:hypothetical protein